MSISKQMFSYQEKSSWIRKMFEEGLKLKQELGEDRVFDLTLGNPDLPPPEDVYLALKEMVENYKPEYHRYMPNAGFEDVRAKMAEKVTLEQGVKVSAKEVVMTCGAAGALNIIFKALLNPGEEVLFPSPFFVEYFFYTENHQGIPKPVPTKDDFSLDLSAFEEAITERTKIVLINSPNNPTGQVYSEEEIKGLAELLSEKSKKFGKTIYLVSDEPYRNLTFDGVAVPSILKHYSNSIIAYSFSKELGLAGERIGFAAVHPEIEEKELLLSAMIMANRILGFVNAPALAQRIVMKCAFSKVKVEIYQERRDILCSILDEANISYVRPKGGLFIFPNVNMDDVAFCEHLKKWGILVVPGRGFGKANHVRLSLCVPAEKLKALREPFLSAISQLKSRP